MSHIDDIRRELLDRGIGLTLEGGKLRAIARKGALDEVAVALIRMHRDGLIALLSAAGPNRAPLTRRDRQGLGAHRLPVSYEQGRMWFLQSIDTEPARYNMPLALRVRGDFDESLAERAFERIVGRHEALRTVFEADGQTLSQRVQELSAFVLGRQDLRGLPESDREGLAWMAAEREATTPFDLARDVMLRASFIRLTDDEGVLLFNVHHIAADGWSMDVVKREFATQYNALRSGRQDNPLAPLAVRYADYAQWQREWLDQDGALEKQLAYWERQLAGLPPVHALALDHARPAQQSFEGATQSFMVDAATTQRLRELGRRTHCTLFMVLHAGLSVLLARHASASDIVIGTPVANRLHKELEDVVGFFANTLVLRTDTSGNPSFEQLLAQVREVNLQAQAHQDVPFEMLVERLNPARSAQYGPLVQIVLNLEAGASAATEAGIALPGLRVTTLGRAVVSAKFELQFNVEEVQGGLALGIDYNCALFEAQTIERMAQHWQRLLHSIAADATLGIHDLPMLAQGESTELLHRLNVRRAVHAVEQGLHERFEAQVRQAPRAIAAEYEGESLSYAELDAQANRLARHLREQGVGVDSLVGLSVERGLPMLVGLLAILKAGGAYVPLDPAYPAGRLAYMVGDSGMKLVLSQSSLRDKLGEITAQTAGIQLLELDDAQLQQQLQRYSAEALERLPGQGPGNLAYIIYTSGSTGQPKGVQIEHANVVRLFESAKRHFAFDASDVWTMFHSYGFDFSVWEIWGALLHGGRLVIVPQAVARSAPEFYELLQQRGVTILNQTPSAFAALVAVDELQPPNPPAALALRQVIFGGEALNLTALRPWMQRHGDASPELVNMYGITETTVHVTYRRIVQADVWAQSPPSVIGEVLDDLSALVLTPQGGLCPLGVAGELYVGGAGLARGYLNRSELTAQRFIANPFHDAQDPRSSERLYRTGDLVRYQADRTLEYLGRIDEQVKIRGFRIELGEIEAQLAAQDGVSSAVVLVQETQPGDKRLIGYVAGSACTGAELKSKLREVLPEYMVPTHIVVLEQLPLTTNGKVDRKALPEPSSEQQEAVYEAPVTSTEKLLASIWAELLQVDVQGIGAQANFFALGGHSLMVIRLMARLQEVGHAVEVRSVFAAPTLRALAQAIDAAEQEGRAQQAFQAPPNAIPAGCERLTPEMLPLVQLTQAQLDEIVGQVPGGAANVQDIYPLAPLQQGIHFHHSLHAEHDPYVLPALLEVDDEPALQALLSALQQVIDRHDALRTAVLPLREHGAVQVVWRQALLPCQELALEAGEDALQQMQRRLEAPQRMVLTQAPLLHAELARDPAGTRCFVLLRLHHIVSDHLGLERVHAEVQACLEGRAQQLPAPLPYREFVAHAQHQARSGDAEEFFRERLADVDEPTAPYGLLDVHGDGRGVVERRRSLDEGLARRIRETARLQRVGPATLFHAAWALVVSATSGRDDVVFGTVLSGRLQGTRGAEHTLGLFINTLPLRLRLRGQSAQGLLRQTEEALTGLLAHEQTPLALAQRCSALPSGTPLFTAMLNYRHDAHLQSSAIEPAATACFRLLRMQERTNYPFNLAVDDFDAGFELMAQVDKSLDAPALLDHMLRALEHLTHALEQNPDSAVLKLDLLPIAERQALLLDLNRTHSPYPDHSSVHACFEAQVARTPERTAVEDAKSALSYGELDVRAQMLASVLAAHGVRRGDRVGLCVERGVDMVSGLLGILKAGAAYLPLDPAYPPARLAHMVHDSAMPVLLTQRSLRDQVEALTAGHPGLRIVCLEDCEAPVTGARPDAVGPDDLLYVIYTSGSTGQPKGVEILHRGAVNLAQAQSRLFEVKSGSRVLAFASIGFDAAASEWLMSLLVGATLVICGETERHAPAALEDFLIEHRVTHATIPPAMLTHMRPDRPYVLRCLVLAGEAFSRELVQAWTQRCAVFNAYGPTEVTVCASATRLHAGEEITLGAPIANTRLHVLDAQGRLVPRGVAGELYVEGVGLARGYLGRPQLSAERFVVNPFHDPEDPGSGARLYRTGDRVRRRADGALLFLGRADDQIKLQGVRIELGEIERQLAQDPRVATAAVLLREDRPGHKRLVAYLVPQVETAIEVQAVRARLREVLPDTMVPAAFVVLDALPLNRSGKVDRRALPAPALTADAALAETPVSPTEQLLADLWTVLLELGNEPVGRSSSFFALGGDSLKVVQLAAEVRERLGVELSLKAVFAEPTLMGVAAQIDGLREQAAEQLAEEARRAALLGAPGLAQAGKKKRQVMA